MGKGEWERYGKTRVGKGQKGKGCRREGEMGGTGQDMGWGGKGKGGRGGKVRRGATAPKL